MNKGKSKAGESGNYSQLPGKMYLSPNCQLVYVVIRSFMNWKTREAWPSVRTIAGKSGLSVPTVRSCVKELEKYGYLSVRKDGKMSVYVFGELDDFEPFSDEFLSRKDISPSVKSFLVASQQYMFKDVEGYGRIDYSDSELADKIGCSGESVRRYNNELASKGFMNIVRSGRKDLVTGCERRSKLYSLGDLGQAVIWKLKEHDERISALEEESERSREESGRRIAALEEENRRLLESSERQEKALSDMRELLDRLLSGRRDAGMEMF